MIKLKVEGMTCGHCVKAVEQALAGVAGVSAVREVSLERGEAVVDGAADLAELLAVVREEGYDAEAA